MKPQPDEEAGAEDAGEKPKNEGTRSLQERYGYNPLILAENTHPEQGFDMRKNPCEIVDRDHMILWWRKQDDRDEGYSRGGMGIVPMVWQTPFHFHPTNAFHASSTD